MEFLQALMEYGYLQNALLAGWLAALGCGVIGSYVVVKRISFLAGGIAHSVLGGMGIAYYFGFPVLAGALIAAIVSALLIGWVKLHWQEREDTLISALWSIGMATGILFISQAPGYNVDLTSYLFGNILMVPEQDLYVMAVLDILILLTIFIFYKQFLAVCFDEEFAQLRGISVNFFYLLLLCLVALNVVLLIQVVGLILVIALLTLPAAIAAQHTQSLKMMMLIATLLGILLTSGGLGLAYTPDFPPGASIVLLAGCAYVLSSLYRAWSQHQQRRLNQGASS